MYDYLLLHLYRLWLSFLLFSLSIFIVFTIDKRMFQLTYAQKLLLVHLKIIVMCDF